MAITNTRLLEKRAEVHWDTALLLKESNDEWAAVLAFYSCYQLARSALLSDPIFDDEQRLIKDLHHNLRTEDKYVTKHEVHLAGKDGNGFGINDLVHQLYRYVSGLYRALHRGSIEVRYENGLQNSLTIDTQLNLAELFRAEYQSGNLAYDVARHLEKIQIRRSQ